MNFLFTGARGFVGTIALAAFSRKGHVLRAVASQHSRNDQADNAIKVDWRQMSLKEGESGWASLLVDIDVIIHLAARVHIMHDDASNPLEEFRKVNVAGTENLARAAAASGVKRLVYVSSVKVNGEETHSGRRYTEVDVPAPQDPYGISKWEAEQALHRVAQETGLEVVIVRPPLVYGAGVKGNFVQMLKVLAKGIPLPLASVNNLRSLVYVENLVDALILCATHPAAAGQTYLVSDGEDISTPELLHRLGVAMGHPARLIPCPEVVLKLLGKLAGRSGQVERLLGSLQVDSGKIRRELNWTPPYSLQQGLQETAEWYRRNHL